MQLVCKWLYFVPNIHTIISRYNVHTDNLRMMGSELEKEFRKNLPREIFEDNALQGSLMELIFSSDVNEALVATLRIQDVCDDLGIWCHTLDCESEEALEAAEKWEEFKENDLKVLDRKVIQS